MSFESIGDVQHDQEDLVAAKASYGSALALRRSLAASLPTDAKRQRALALDDKEVGQLAAEQGARQDALAAFSEGKAIIMALLSATPADPALAGDLATMNEAIAKVSP